LDENAGAAAEAAMSAALTAETLELDAAKACGALGILAPVSCAPLVEESPKRELEPVTQRDGNLLSNSSHARTPHVPLPKSSLQGVSKQDVRVDERRD